jgi:tRNA 2-thiocytidine biosynthesis protein TtcA
MSSITIEELKKLPAESYQIIDIRDEIEISHGAVKGALACKPEEIMENPEVDKTRKLVICCSRGINSKEIAKKLEEEGLDAVSLEKGYIAWLMDAMKSSQDEDFAKTVEISLRKKFKKKIWSRFTKAINTYELVKPGDRIAVCISGGKDSMLMAKLFQELLKHGKANFELVFLVMNPGYNKDNWKIIQDNAKVLGIPLTVFETQIFDTVADIDKNPCYLCARMRRGYLYSHAKELGCNKIALGHHFDDVIETILMGMFYGGKVETMMPKLHSQNFEGMELIRPMYLIKEDDIIAWRDYNQLNFIQCACRFTENCVSCGGGRGSKRDEMKELIKEFRKQGDIIEKNIFRSVHNVNLRTIIGYHKDDMEYNFLDDYNERGK